ncbi:MAG: LEA type 2 family protein [Prevotellaceae bacterium]|jgi:LEA14-like dessication related protein|nr:LEA type 2 family protein [Prevotellaceae bacterium]
MKHSHWLLFLFLLLLSSCGNLSNVDISYDGDVELRSVKGSKATFIIPATVDNPTGHALKLKKVELNIYRKGYTFAELNLPKTLKIPAHTNQLYELQLEIYFKNPFALIEDDFDIEEEIYTLEGYIKIGVGLLSKKLKFKEVTFNQLIKQLKNL